MKKIRMALFALATLVLLATSTGCGGGGGGGSDDDTPVAESGSTGGSGGGSISVTEGLVPVSGATFDGTTAITLSGVFIAGRTVTIPSLWACDHEVTQAEYQSVMGSNPSSFSSSPASGETQANRPVENVNWYDALVYCNKRSLAEQLMPCYTINNSTNPDDWGSVPTSSTSSNKATWDAAECNFNANGYRLPTEAEWEYLARGGNLTNNGQTTYSGSNTMGDVAWCTTNSESKTHQVKTKDSNGKNLYDMSGNVLEWCWDWYDDSISSFTPSTGAASGSYRVARGGSYNNGIDGCPVRRRFSSNPDYRSSRYGFRVVSSRSE